MSSASPEPSGSQAAADDAGPTYTGMPRWVKWFVIALVVLALALLVGKLAGGEHGPSRHGAGNAPAGSVSVAAPLR